MLLDPVGEAGRQGDCSAQCVQVQRGLPRGGLEQFQAAGKLSWERSPRGRKKKSRSQKSIGLTSSKSSERCMTRCLLSGDVDIVIPPRQRRGQSLADLKLDLIQNLVLRLRSHRERSLAALQGLAMLAQPLNNCYR